MAKSKATIATTEAGIGAVKHRRSRRADPTADMFPEFAAGVERAKRVRVILRKLADWPAADVAMLVTALRERADPATAGEAGSIYPFGSGQKAWEEFQLKQEQEIKDAGEVGQPAE